MASIYERKDSPFIWIKYKDTNGKWCAMNSGFRADNYGDRKLAERLAKQRTLEELANKPIRSAGWDWVIPWVNTKWGDVNAGSATARQYGRYWLKWREYFDEHQITTPAALRREHLDQYFDWRLAAQRRKRKASRNTSIQEIKFLKQVLKEAVSREYLLKNPLEGYKATGAPAKEKLPWSESEVATVEEALEKRDKYEWMHVTFLMGYHQAVRLRQSELPISCIDFQRRLINYPRDVVKGQKAYSQPISPVFYPMLRDIIDHRQGIGKATLCDIPDKGHRPASIQWREFLDELGFKHLCHHGLRATWITQAALRGIPESLAKRFVNHASTQVHEIYQKITATDLMPMLDAFLLAKPNALALPPK